MTALGARGLSATSQAHARRALRRSLRVAGRRKSRTGQPLVIRTRPPTPRRPRVPTKPSSTRSRLRTWPRSSRPPKATGGRPWPSSCSCSGCGRPKSSTSVGLTWTWPAPLSKCTAPRPKVPTGRCRYRRAWRRRSPAARPARPRGASRRGMADRVRPGLHEQVRDPHRRWRPPEVVESPASPGRGRAPQVPLEPGDRHNGHGRAGGPARGRLEDRGHKDPAFTARVYNEIRPERLRAAADALQEHYYGAAR